MNQVNEFLDLLEEELRYLNPKDAAEVLKHYREKINVMIDYGDNEAKIIASLPKPSKIAEDIYNTKGINYLEKRKKVLKRKSIFKAILSCIILVLIISGFVSVGYFFTSTIINIFNLTIKSFVIESLIDKLSLILFNLTYIFIILIALIYIFDLLYYMASFSIENIIRVFEKKAKEYKFLDFSLSDLIETKLKKEKVLSKILLGSVICFLFFGIVNYATSGYINRSMNDTVILNQKNEIKGNIKSIIVEDSKAFVTIKTSEKINRVTINYGNEFNEKLNYVVKDGICTIQKVTSSTFDILGLLDEPLPKIEILIPTTMAIENIDISITDGFVDIVDVNKSIKMSCVLKDTTCALTRVVMDELNVVANSSSLALEENIINKVNVNITNGKYYSVKDSYQELQVENHLAQIVFKETKSIISNIYNRSAQVAMDKVIFDHLEYVDANSESYFNASTFNISSFSSLGNSDIEFTDSSAITSIKFITESGIIDTTNLVTPLLEIENSNGTITLIKLNKKANLINTFANITSSKGKIEFIDSSLTKANYNLNNTTVIITNTFINETIVSLVGSTMNISDLHGTKIDVDVNGGSFAFYNDNITSDIVLTITGELVKTSIDVDKNIKTIMESGENN